MKKALICYVVFLIISLPMAIMAQPVPTVDPTASPTITSEEAAQDDAYTFGALLFLLPLLPDFLIFIERHLPFRT